MRRSAFLLLGLFVLFTGCDSSDPGEPMGVNSITGTWRGELISVNAMGQEQTFNIHLNLNESRTNVGGDGTVTGPSATVSFVIEEGSSYVHPFLSIDMIYEGSFPGGLNGNVSEDRRTIQATMSGLGFSGSTELQIVLTQMAP